MRQRAATLVELAVVLGLVGLLALAVPSAVFQGVRAFVFLPKAQVTSQVAMEALHAMVEGSHSEGLGRTVRGLRHATSEVPPPLSPPGAIWAGSASTIGFVTSDGDIVWIQLAGGEIRRAVLSSFTCPPPGPLPEETIPYYAGGVVQVEGHGPGGALFRYFDVNGTELTFPVLCSSHAAVRRIEIELAARTGGGSFDQGDARVEVTSSVAVRFP